jgi:RNA polymerase sigma factor (TIGR02999 family)
MNEVTRILSAVEQGDPHAAEQLLPLVYDELRRLAAAQLAQEKPGQTLDATALVHEAYLRLVGDQHFETRRHFFAAAAAAMRRILVENARRKLRQKHGGHLMRRPLDQIDVAAADSSYDLLALHGALQKLTAADATAAQTGRASLFRRHDDSTSCRTDESIAAYGRPAVGLCTRLSAFRDLFGKLNKDLA